MNTYDEAFVASKIESAQNEIRRLHNDMESKKWFGRKNYMPYCSEKFIEMINVMGIAIKDMK